MRLVRLTVYAALVLTAPSVAVAADVSADPSSYRNQIAQLSPGDRLILAAGDYDGLPLDGVNGSAAQPIVITGPESGAPAVIVGRSCCNTISIRNSSYLVLRYLDVDVRGELVDGLKAESDSGLVHHVTVEYVDFFNFGQDQQIVGINTKCDTSDWIIRNNTISGAGTGIYLGGSTGGTPFVGGLIEYNLVVNPLGYGMQIKHQTGRPQGLPSDAVTIVRHNVFIKAANASTGDEARPNLLVGHFPDTGAGSNDSYQIYGNFFFENASVTEALFQGEGRFSFHDNVMVNSFGSGMYVQPQNGDVKDVSIYHNTFLVAGDGIDINGGAGFTQRVVGNAIFAGGTPISGGQQSENVTAAMAMAGGFVNQPAPELGMLDLFPTGTALSGAPIDLSPFAGDIDGTLDFNGTERDGAWRGAYHGSGQNPGWMLAEEVKTLTPSTNPVPDGGVSTDDSGVPPIDAGFDDAGNPIAYDAGFDDAGTGPNTSDGGLEIKDANTGSNPGLSGRGTSGGCTCVDRGSAPLALWILVLVPWMRRKQLKQNSSQVV